MTPNEYHSAFQTVENFVATKGNCECNWTLIDLVRPVTIAGVVYCSGVLNNPDNKLTLIPFPGDARDYWEAITSWALGTDQSPQETSATNIGDEHEVLESFEATTRDGGRYSLVLVQLVEPLTMAGTIYRHAVINRLTGDISLLNPDSDVDERWYSRIRNILAQCD